jgi:hypothetical protein
MIQSATQTELPDAHLVPALTANIRNPITRRNLSSS